MRLSALALTVVTALVSTFASAQAAMITTTAVITGSNFVSGAPGVAPVDPVQIKFSITLDPTATYTNETSGIVIDSANIGYSGPLRFDYNGHGGISIGASFDGLWSVTWGTDDFFAAFQLIYDPSYFTTSTFMYSQQGINNIFYAGDLNVATTPIPAALPLFMTAIAGLGAALGLRRKRTQGIAL